MTTQDDRDGDDFSRAAMLGGDAMGRLIARWVEQLHVEQPWLSRDECLEVARQRAERARETTLKANHLTLIAHRIQLAALSLRIAKGQQDKQTIRAKQHSSNHRLLEAMRAGKLAGNLGKPGPHSEENMKYFSTFVPIVPKHNWLDMLGDSIVPEIGDEWRLPFDQCCFEYDLVDIDASVTHVASFIGEDNKGALLIDFVEVEGYWACVRRVFAPTLGELRQACIDDVKNPANPNDGTWTFDFIRAACIAIDCKGAVAEDVEVPPKLAHKREREGKAPLPTYKVINVRRREGVAHKPGELPSRRMRLHLRRGHWWPRLDNHESRFDRFRTWRPWRLVGDPDLGYIEHEYRI